MPAATRNRTPALQVPWCDDEAAQAFVASHPNGATASEVTAVYGLSRQAIELIEKQAIRSMMMRLVLVGVTRTVAAGLGRSDESEAA